MFGGAIVKPSASGSIIGEGAPYGLPYGNCPCCPGGCAPTAFVSASVTVLAITSCWAFILSVPRTDHVRSIRTARCRCTHFTRVPRRLRPGLGRQQSHARAIAGCVRLVCFRHRDAGFVISRNACRKFAPAVERDQFDGLAEAAVAERTGIGTDDDSTAAGDDGNNVAATDQGNAADIDR